MKTFLNITTVWSQSMESFINEFITTGGPLSEPDKTSGLQTQLPPIFEQFGEQYSKYRAYHNLMHLVKKLQ
jgi:hypothetical protein